jgi:hypothetical protein
MSNQIILKARRALGAATIVAGLGVTSAFISRQIVLTRQDRSKPVMWQDIKTGRELVLVFLGSTGCSASRATGFDTTWTKIQTLIRQGTQSSKWNRISTVGVAIDWLPSEGLDYLRSIGRFDEVIAGRNWLGSGVDRYVRGTGAVPATPQILVLERTVQVGDGAYLFTDEKVLLTKAGLREINEWVSSGAQVQ